MAHQPTILLVEDDPDDEVLTMQALQARGDLRIQVVRDGQQALDYLLGQGAWENAPEAIPDLCLLDLNLPRVNGHEVLKRLRASPRTRLFPVVVLSSSIDDQDVAAAYAAGANGYVRKDVDFAQFRKSVQSLTSYWFDVNRAPPAQSTA